MNRRRYKTRGGARGQTRLDFINPFPNIPSTDARVMIRLNQLGVPYSYRYFNADNAYIKELLPGWAPEFTLKDYKLVILVIGTFFGQIPAVISQNSLGKVILEQAGWKVLEWHQVDIESRLDFLFAQAPNGLGIARIKGPPYRNPFAASLPNIMKNFYLMRSKASVRMGARQIVRTRGTARRRNTSSRGSFVLGRRSRDYRTEPGGSRSSRSRRRGFGG